MRRGAPTRAYCARRRLTNWAGQGVLCARTWMMSCSVYPATSARSVRGCFAFGHSERHQDRARGPGPELVCGTPAEEVLPFSIGSHADRILCTVASPPASARAGGSLRDFSTTSSPPPCSTGRRRYTQNQRVSASGKRRRHASEGHVWLCSALPSCCSSSARYFCLLSRQSQEANASVSVPGKTSGIHVT